MCCLHFVALVCNCANVLSADGMRILKTYSIVWFNTYLLMLLLNLYLFKIHNIYIYVYIHIECEGWLLVWLGCGLVWLRLRGGNVCAGRALLL